MKLESIGKLLGAGFGDRVAVGVFMGFLQGVTPGRACEYIRDGIELGYWLSEESWQKYGKLARQAKLAITTEDIIVELRKRRPDLLGVILNDLKGRPWLDNQIANMKRKLGLE
ncbi:hypothetical protein ES707_01419 [subsurface metagenome]